MYRMKNRKRRFLFIPFALAGLALFTWFIMLLWNGVLTAATGVHTITYFQALGIFVLSKILFGFGGGWGGSRRGSSKWREIMLQKYANMSPEEREKIKEEWKNRCGSRWDRDEVSTETNT